MTTRLAISNIAWDAADDARVASLLAEEGCQGVEIAPTKRWPKPLEATSAEIVAYRDRWKARGLPIVAMQALLFGQPDLHLFTTLAARDQLAAYLRGIIDLGEALGARALVFGSPKNRLRGELSDHEASEIATEFFHAIGDYALAHNVVVCIEANPPEYGADFLTTTEEAVVLSKRIRSSGVRVQGDLGGMTLAGEDPSASIRLAAPVLGHFHASEPHLVETGTGGADHRAAAAALRAAAYDGWVSIEMKTAPVDPMEAIRRALRYAKSVYV